MSNLGSRFQFMHLPRILNAKCEDKKEKKKRKYEKLENLYLIPLYYLTS